MELQIPERPGCNPMQEILEKLNRVRGVGGCVVLSGDGLPMASALRSGADEDSISAAVGGVVEQSGNLCRQLELGQPRATQVLTGGQGGLLVIAAGNGWLAIIMDPTANLALLQLEVRPFAERIAQRLTL